MKNFVIAALLFFSSCTAMSPVYAASRIAIDGAGNSITIFDEKCTNKAAASLLPKLNAILKEAKKPLVDVRELRAGVVFHEGKRYGACWVRVENVVVVLDEAGEDSSIFPVPVQAFELPNPI